MRSETELKVPSIDLTKEALKPGSNSWVEACKVVRYALEEYGCFEVIYDKVPIQLHNSVFEAMDELFGLPLETKMQKTSDRPYHNYFGQYSPLPLYESLSIQDPTTLEGTQNFTQIMFPSGNDRLCETSRTFSKLVAELNEIVTRMVFDCYGLGKLYECHIAATTYQLRCFKYRERRVDETDLGLHSHTDLTFTSILNQHEVSGLQIKAKDGEWIDVPPSPSSFIILAGDALMAWSNERARSCDHRVIMKENKKRYSLGLFSFSNGMIHVPEELVDDEHPILYKPFNHFEFMRFNQREAAKRFICPIKAYCGV